jgi:acetyltransferase-like isoleucine patch superfamily enzyme
VAIPGERLESDWFPGEIPSNIELGKNAYLDSAYTFAAFFSLLDPGLSMGYASGAYNRTTFIVGEKGKVEIGDYTCLNNTYLICNENITIGNHCLLSWGVIVTDSPVGVGASIKARRAALRGAANSRDRWLPPLSKPLPVRIGDNVWIGFDAVIEPGVQIGRGSIIGSKSRVCSDVPPYTVAVGSPARIIQQLPANDEFDALRRDLFKSQVNKDTDAS